MNGINLIRPLKFRSIWISDVHLGTRGCHAEKLLDFLRATETEYLYLVGDIIDIWQMRRGLYWPQAHNNVIRMVLGKAKHDSKVTYVPGNHDELLRDFNGMEFGNVTIRERAVHTTADGRRLLVLHGDEFDSVVACSPFIAKLGSAAYDLLLIMNRPINWVRRKVGLNRHWSLSRYLKHRVKNAVNYISNFERAVSREAELVGADGLVCGHIHHAEIRDFEGTLYCNCGDWVESFSALVELHDGTLKLLHWNEIAAAQSAHLPELKAA